MSIIENISNILRRYKEANNLTMSELAQELGIAVSSLQGYLDGTANPRMDTVEQLSEKAHIPVMEMLSGPFPEWKRAETVIRAARELGDLPEEKRERGIQLFLQLTDLFEEEDA